MSNQVVLLDGVASQETALAYMHAMAVPADCRIDAREDVEAVRLWAASKAALSVETQESYRVAATKFMWWCAYRGLALAQIRFQDVDQFQAFCQRPPDDLPARAPFRKAMAASSAEQTVTIVRNLIAWLAKARYIAHNPLDLQSRKRKGRATRRSLSRYITDPEWEWVETALRGLPRESRRDRVHFARCNWLFAMLLYAGLRLSEVCTNTMASMRHVRSGDFSGWFMVVVGKGDKEREIPVPDVLIDHLRTYRAEMGLPVHFGAGDTTPLLLSITGRRAIGRRAVAAIVEVILREALCLARNAGLSDSDVPALAGGSTHWLRHTYGTRLGNNGVSIHTIRDNLGHGSIETSSIYVHTDKIRRHRESVGGADK